MYARLEETSRWLEWLGLDHRAVYTRMLERLAGTRADDLRRLADVVEPLEDYQRGNTGHYTQLSPYNRLMDAARPESDAARRFARHVDAFLADPTRQAGREAIRQRLQEWQQLEPRLRPLLEGNEILREAVPLSAEASALAAAGLEAAGFLEEQRVAPESWWTSRAPLLTREETPRTGLEVAYRPSIKRLMEAATGR
jgi:hexosaminidase